MKRPILSYHEKEAAASAAEAIRDTGVYAMPGSESDREKTVYTVYVEEPDEHRVLQTLPIGETDGAIRCPACRSVSVEFPARARASGLLYAIDKLGDIFAPPAKQPFRCRRCENHWS